MSGNTRDIFSNVNANKGKMQAVDPILLAVFHQRILHGDMGAKMLLFIS